MLTQTQTSTATVSAVDALIPSNTIVTTLDVNLTKYYSDGHTEAIHQLNGSISVTYTLTDAQVASITDVNTARLLYYNPDTKALEPITATFDLVKKTVTFSVNHFSTFVIEQGLNTSSTTSSGTGSASVAPNTTSSVAGDSETYASKSNLSTAAASSGTDTSGGAASSETAVSNPNTGVIPLKALPLEILALAAVVAGGLYLVRKRS